MREASISLELWPGHARTGRKPDGGPPSQSMADRADDNEGEVLEVVEEDSGRWWCVASSEVWRGVVDLG